MSSSDRACFCPCDILLPRTGHDLFSVVACDQHTSNKAYWKRVDKAVGAAPSALRLILPEAFLGEDDTEARLCSIAEKSEEYLSGGVFNTYENSFVLIKRTFSNGITRTGLVGALDLSLYDYERPGASIAASEETVPSRLPPRERVLRAQRVETSHVIALIDDIEKTVIEPLLKLELPKLYEFVLMENGGVIRGYQVTGDAAACVCRAMHELKGPPVVVVGDGNHSLAAARHLGRRYALAELCNVYDEGIVIEPIHRVAFGAEKAAVIEMRGANARYSELIAQVDECLAKSPHDAIDYIHGEDEARRVAADSGRGPATVVILPVMEKSEIFATVRAAGKFPRKSFSIGSAEEKRYYLECKTPE